MTFCCPILQALIQHIIAVLGTFLVAPNRFTTEDFPKRTFIIVPVPVRSPAFGIKKRLNSGFFRIGFMSHGKAATKPARGAILWKLCINPPTSFSCFMKPIGAPKLSSVTRSYTNHRAQHAKSNSLPVWANLVLKIWHSSAICPSTLPSKRRKFVMENEGAIRFLLAA